MSSQLDAGRAQSERTDRALRVTKADRLIVYLWATVAANPVGVVIRGRDLHGGNVHIATISGAITSAAVTRLDVPLFDGWLEAVSVGDQLTSLLPYDVLGRIVVARGQVTDQTAVVSLAAGSVSAFGSLTWPYPVYGYAPDDLRGLYVESVADPAAGAPFQLAQAGNVGMELHGGGFSLTTSAAVANRQVFAEFSASGSVVQRIASRTVQPASTTYNYYFWYAASVPADAAPTIVLGMTRLGLPDGGTLDVSAVNIQAGDQFGGINLICRRWLTSISGF